MLHIRRLLNGKLSTQISVKIVLAIAILLAAALFVMLRFSRKAVKEEARRNAEQTLEYTVRQIDNILLSVEQSVGNVYWDMLTHLDEPDKMYTYAEKLVRCNSYIAGCAIAFEPYYYKEKGEYFLAYVHRSYNDDLGTPGASIYRKAAFGNVPYTEQSWYRQPIDMGRPTWIDPLDNEVASGVAITSFCIPIYAQGGHRVGVLAVDVTLSLISKIVLTTKTSPNSYAIMLGRDGSYIVHPNASRVANKSIITEEKGDYAPEVKAAVDSMLAGATGYQRFKLDGVDNYVFYKPFERSVVPGRSMEDSGWSIGLIYPEEDIFGTYNRLLRMIVLIAVVGITLLFFCCRAITHRQLLPLRMLTASAQRIAEGHYDDAIPDTLQQDEVGTLQRHFQQMQQALSVHVGELERLNARLHKQGEMLAKSYDRVKEADRVKTAFLHNMTDQMMCPVAILEQDVTALCQQDQNQDQTGKLVEDITKQGKVVTDLLNDLLKMSQEQGREESV